VTWQSGENLTTKYTEHTQKDAMRQFLSWHILLSK